MPNDIPPKERNARSAELSRIFQQIALENNQSLIGQTETVVVEKPGQRVGTTIARDHAYRPIALTGDYPVGKSLTVKIVRAEAFALIAEVME